MAENEEVKQKSGEETAAAEQSLTEISKAEKNQKIMVALGGGIYVDATLESTKKVCKYLTHFLISLSLLYRRILSRFRLASSLLLTNVCLCTKSLLLFRSCVFPLF